jgi:asparagine synthase (glutamine-hydrolysing)
MCGIAGILSHREPLDETATRRHLRRMIEEVRHRGRDDSGTRVVGRAGLAHRRLAIIDLNRRSAQPMQALNGAVWITFNGEIYNFLDLRRELEAKGCVFRTTSDTEVLLFGWRIWGVDLIAKLRGMFAFALWDRDQEVMLLARDRFGKKPLFYHNDDDRLLFASEIKSILEWPGFERRVDMGSIHDFMTFHYCIGSDSAFEGVRKLPPAHYMLLRPGHAPRPVRYWRLAPVDPTHENRSIEELCHELRERLDDAIRCRLIADVPVGAFLSGGVDSSALTARIARMVSQPLETFSVGFAMDGYDETAYAQQVAERYGTTHRSFIMGHGLVQELPRLIWHYGEPYADSSALVTYGLAREVRKHVTVAITGDGGDEIFLGYSRYARFQQLIQQWRAGKSPKLPYQSIFDFDNRPRIRDHYARSISSFREEHKLNGYGPMLAPYLFTSSHEQLGVVLEGADADNAIDTLARSEIETYLPDDLLVKADIATMAVGLEARSPFLDHELADWAASLPQSKRVFLRGGSLEMKALLKKAAEPDLDAELLYRRKQGFSVPVARWMRREIRDFMIDTLTSRRFHERGLVHPRFIQFMMERHFSNFEDHGTRLWALLCLELWFQTFIDRPKTGPLTLDVTAASPARVVEAALH